MEATLPFLPCGNPPCPPVPALAYSGTKPTRLTWPLHLLPLSSAPLFLGSLFDSVPTIRSSPALPCPGLQTCNLPAGERERRLPLFRDVIHWKVGYDCVMALK